MPGLVRVPAALLVLVIASAAACAQNGGQPAQPQSAQPSPQPAPVGREPIEVQVPALQVRDPGVLTLHAAARAVLVDVVVTDAHGHPVHGLKPGDFAIFEDGKLQTISSLEEHHPPTAVEIAAQPKPLDLGPNTWTNYKPQIKARDAASIVFLFDALNTAVEDQMYVHDQILAFLDRMPPGTEVAIFQLDTQLRMLQGFSSDPAVLRNAVKTRDKPTLSVIPINRGPVAQRFRQDILSGAMQSLGSYLSTWPGRKNLIWFTAHIPRSVYDDGSALGGSLHDSESLLFDYAKSTDALVLGQVSVYPVDARGLQTDPTLSVVSHPGSRPTSADFARDLFADHADLDAIAEATGGKAFYNTNGIRQSVAEVAETGSSFYTLSFRPANRNWDGSFRKLRLELRGTPNPAGAQLQYRRGYYALAEPVPTLEAPARDASGRKQLTFTGDNKAFIQSMQLGAVDPGQLTFAARVTEQPQATKFTAATMPKDIVIEPKFRGHSFRLAEVLYRVGGRQLEISATPDGRHQGHLEFVALVLDSQGALVESVTSTVDMNMIPASYNKMMTTALLMLQKIAIPEKGQYFLRVGVQDRASHKSAALEIATGDIQIAAAARP